MISKTLKTLCLLAIASTIGILTIFSIWEVPVNQQQVEIEIDSAKFTK